MKHPETDAPFRLSDEELVALGAYLRGDATRTPDDKANAIATIGVKLTGFFMSVAKIAVEHYDREVADDSNP